MKASDRHSLGLREIGTIFWMIKHSIVITNILLEDVDILEDGRHFRKHLSSELLFICTRFHDQFMPWLFDVTFYFVLIFSQKAYNFLFNVFHIVPSYGIIHITELGIKTVFRSCS